MVKMIDKRARASLFRQRLASAMDAAGLSQSGLARDVRVDRSTISALLSPGTRLPNAGLAADCALALGTTTDWLLGQADRSEPLDKALDRAFQMLPASRALFDDTLIGWHRAARGAKIRHVPTSLPDILKTPDVVTWEYAATLGSRAPEAFARFDVQLEELQSLRSDFEIALPLHELASFAGASGYWQGLPLAARRGQISHLIALCDRLYPALRLCLYDARRIYSPPMTVFGPHIAALYLGQSYLAITETGKVAELSQHFDSLVRAAEIGARDVALHLQSQLNALSGD